MQGILNNPLIRNNDDRVAKMRQFEQLERKTNANKREIVQTLWGSNSPPPPPRMKWRDDDEEGDVRRHRRDQGDVPIVCGCFPSPSWIFDKLCSCGHGTCRCCFSACIGTFYLIVIGAVAALAFYGVSSFLHLK